MARRRQWFDNLISLPVATTADVTLQLLQHGFADQDRKGMTLARIIADLSINALAPGTVLSTQVLDMGIGIASEEAISVADGVPPIDDENEQAPSGYLWRHRALVRLTTIGTGESEWPYYRVAFDVGAKRKLMYGVPYLVVYNSLVGGTGHTMVLTGLIRMLYYLP